MTKQTVQMHYGLAAFLNEVQGLYCVESEATEIKTLLHNSGITGRAVGVPSQDACRVFLAGVSDWHDTRLTSPPWAGRTHRPGQEDTDT